MRLNIRMVGLVGMVVALLIPLLLHYQRSEAQETVVEYQFSGSVGLARESEAFLTIFVQRTATTGEASVQCIVSSGTATAGLDFDPGVVTATFADGDLYAPCNIPVIGDSLAESLETATVNLGLLSGGILGPQAAAELLIVDDDGAGTYEFSSAEYSVSESAGSFAFSVIRSGDPAGGNIVSVTVQPGTATLFADWEAGAWDFFMHEGTSSAGASISITNDAVAELAETFTLVITQVAGPGFIGSVSVATVTIIDDDAGGPPPAFSISHTMPANGTPGDPSLVTIMGAGILPGALLELQGPGFLMPGLPLTVLSDGTMATFSLSQLPSGMLPGPYNLRVVNPGGVFSNPIPFIINPSVNVACAVPAGALYPGGSIVCGISAGSDAGVTVTPSAGLALDPGYVPNGTVATVATLTSTGQSGPVSIAFSWTVNGGPPMNMSLSFIVLSPPIIELRHVDSNFNVIPQQALEILVVGATARFCLFNVAGGGLAPFADSSLSVGNVVVVPGGGDTAGGGALPTFLDAQIFLAPYGQAAGASCVSWISTEAGGQEIAVELPAGDVTWDVRWDTNTDGNGYLPVVNRSLKVGWNRLTGMTLAANVMFGQPIPAPVVGSGDTSSPADVTLHLQQVSPDSYPIVNLSMLFHGAHVRMDGTTFTTGSGTSSLAGVAWSAASSSPCAPVPAGGAIVGEWGSAILVNAMQGCVPGTTIDVSVSGTSPSPLGSMTAPVASGVLHLVLDPPPPPVKTTMLAWAGQRVILETDHRWPKGDLGGTPTPQGSCRFSQPFQVRYIRAAGPGNFIPAPGVSVFGWDEVTVEVGSQTTQLPEHFPSQPQAACISRVIYESEDQGEVDIEAFVDAVGGVPFTDYTKAAFVIYFMKFDGVNLSFPQASKPTFNATGADFAPGNPWDASLDGLQPTWNVSRDLLVRGRVRGWFTTSNPSPRAEDNTNPLNVLPAGRWVMPDDWDLLAGGPDGEEQSGLAEQFRPQYDIMTAPNNAGGFTCAAPAGLCSDATSAQLDFAYGPFSALDLAGPVSAAISPAPLFGTGQTIFKDSDVDWWDAPMPPAQVNVRLRGTGLLKQVLKEDVYYGGSPDQTGQTFPNLFNRSAIPGSPFVPALVAGGGYFWDTWGNDGPGGAGMGAYPFWTAVPALLAVPGLAPDGTSDASVSVADLAAMGSKRQATGDATLSRDLVLYSDNHGEFMVIANGDFKTGATAGGMAGIGTISAVADYPDFRGKHFPVFSNQVLVNWSRTNITSVTPGSLLQGTSGVAITVRGADFFPSSVVLVNGSAVQTGFVSSTELNASVGEAALASVGVVSISIQTGAPSPGVSGVFPIFVTQSTTSVEAADAATATSTEVVEVASSSSGGETVAATTDEGTGTVAVAIYTENPGGTPSFSTELDSYFDVYVAPGSTFSSTTILYCDPAGGNQAFWWTGGGWLPASDQVHDPATGCITITVGAATIPSITELYGTAFAAGIAAPGHVTGGGWFNSPAGACSAFCGVAATGQAHFAFVAQIRKGASVPVGNTAFQFQAGNLDFKSTSYQWLVTTGGSKAQFKGEGTINGAGTYGFMITAIDGALSNGSNKADRFRIKIWDTQTGAVVYDNQRGDADTDDPTTAIGGGSIVIHKEK